MRRFICENPKADYMMMFNLADCVDKCLCRPWRFPVTCSKKFVTQLSTDTRCTLYRESTALYLDMDIITSNCRLRHVFAASSLADGFQMRILGHMFGGCIGSVAVN